MDSLCLIESKVHPVIKVRRTGCRSNRRGKSQPNTAPGWRSGLPSRARRMERPTRACPLCIVCEIQEEAQPESWTGLGLSRAREGFGVWQDEDTLTAPATVSKLNHNGSERPSCPKSAWPMERGRFSNPKAPAFPTHILIAK